MSDDVPLLAVAGLPPLTERVYLFVVHRGRTSPADVVERFDLGAAAATRQLEDLRDVGLVARANGRDDAYAAVDPRYALAAITDGLDDQVRRLRDQIPRLAEQFQQSVADESGSGRTRIVGDAGDVAGWYVRLQHQAQEELVIFDRPPYVSGPLEPLEGVIIGRGVAWRAIYTADSFSREGAWEETARLAEQGEQSRIVPSLPLKLVIADRKIALVSLSLDGISVDALVTEAAPLVELLCLVFEGYWARALPLTAASSGTPDDLLAALQGAPTGPAVAPRPASGRPATAEEQSILALIGAGLTDEAIAARLGLSVRSLRRRSQKLMADLGAANRFQAGVEAARRGWV